MSKIWYAVQEKPTEDYSVGSYDYKKAKRMAKDICRKTGQSIIVYFDEKLSMSIDQEFFDRENL